MIQVAKSAYDVMHERAQRPLRHLVRNPDQMQRFAELAPRYEEVCQVLYRDWSGGSAVADSSYDWASWSGEVRKTFQRGVPLSFLDTPALRQTMVLGRRWGFRATSQRLTFITATYDTDTAERLLAEDPIGAPNLTSVRFRTSACRAAHVYGLAQYRAAMNANFWDQRRIVEWGGGFGTMARVLKRMRPDLTYTILDLPELLSLQYVYLGSILGEDAVHVARPGDVTREGKVNLLPSSSVQRGMADIEADGFLSTWALTESGKEAQYFVARRSFFGARRLLLAFARNTDNVLLQEPFFADLKVVHGEALPLDSDYGFA